jgi:protoporphyrinogen oxidase
MADNIILGAGIAGLAANHYLTEKGISSVCYEKDNVYGGLCASFSVKGFTFDQFVHLSFSKEKEVQNIFKAATEYVAHYPESMNYADGNWIRHPVQNNLYKLPVDEKIKIIKSFTEKPTADKIDDYEEWLKVQYGDYFTEKYPMRYTRKYWGVDARELGTEWTGGRIFVPDLEELLYSALEPKTENVFYAKEMRYPVKGGYQAFLSGLVDAERIIYNKKVVRIDEKKRQIYFSDHDCITYEHLISTLPLPEVAAMLSYADQAVLDAAQKLMYTSGYIVSIGLNRQIDFPALWFYIYDEDILPARVHSPSMKSVNNVPEGKSSLQAEIYFSNTRGMDKSEEEILSETISKLIEIGLFAEEDIELKDIRLIKYANVICDKEIDANRKMVLDYLDRNGIITAGRFGEWKYYWSDQSLLSGKRAADKVWACVNAENNNA